MARRLAQLLVVGEGDLQRGRGCVREPMKRSVAAALLALSSAALLILAFPTFDLQFLVWVGLVPLLVALADKPPALAAALSFPAGVAFFAGVLYWVTIVPGYSSVDVLLSGTYLGSYWALFGGALAWVSRRTRLPLVLTAPSLWVATEYLRSHAGFVALPWALLGHSQYLNVPLIQMASVTGVYGLSFLIVMVNATLARVVLALLRTADAKPLRLRPMLLPPILATVSMLAIALAYGSLVISQQRASDALPVTVLQTNIAQILKWQPEFRHRHLLIHAKLTKEAAKNGTPALVVWPETSVQGGLTRDLTLMNAVFGLAKETNTHLLVGSAARPKFGPREFRSGHRFNSAFLMSPAGGLVGQYNKIRLVPFAEYLPHDGRLPWPARYRSQASNILPGADYTVFPLRGSRFAVLICWENIFPDLARRFALNGADFLVNMTNEAWFAATAAPRQFLAINVFRAVENRLSVVRSANIGISGFIDPNGRIIGTVGNGASDVEGHLTMEVPISRERTFYTRHGDLFAHAVLFAAAGMIVISFVRPRTEADR